VTDFDRVAITEIATRLTKRVENHILVSAENDDIGHGCDAPVKHIAVVRTTHFSANLGRCENTAETLGIECLCEIRFCVGNVRLEKLGLSHRCIGETVPSIRIDLEVSGD